MKHLPLNLAKHPLLIQAFTGEDGKFTTNCMWVGKPCYAIPRRIDSKTYKNLIYFKRSGILEADTYPAPDLEEFLDLATTLWETRKIGSTPWDTEILPTHAEDELAMMLAGIHAKGDRLTRLAEAIIPVLGERHGQGN